MKERSAPELMVSEVTGQRRRKEEEESLVQCSCCRRLQTHTRISHFFPHGVTTRGARAHKISVKKKFFSSEVKAETPTRSLLCICGQCFSPAQHSGGEGNGKDTQKEVCNTTESRGRQRGQAREGNHTTISQKIGKPCTVHFCQLFQF